MVNGISLPLSPATTSPCALTDRKKQRYKNFCLSSGAVEINWNNVRLRLLYHRDLTTGLDLVSVETYLINKYNPDPEDAVYHCHQTIIAEKPLLRRALS